MANNAVDTMQLAFNSTTDVVGTFGLSGAQSLGGVQSITLATSADCYVEFDTTINTAQSFLILAANTANTNIDFHGGTITKIYARGKTGSGTLYVIGTRN